MENLQISRANGKQEKRSKMRTEKKNKIKKALMKMSKL